MNCAFTPGMTRTTRAFSLFEALCMIVTLCVFGWLCVGVVRHEIKHEGKDDHEGVQFTTSDNEPAKTEPAKTELVAPVAKPAETKPVTPWKNMVPEAASKPAGSPAPGAPAPAPTKP
jgi:hypothetical protein